jgi:uncharacterized protein
VYSVNRSYDAGRDVSISNDSAICQACGACCAYDPSWPRFSLESDADLARIPEALVSATLTGMRFVAGRCAALDGTLCEAVTCRIYEVRPIVCRDCLPGDEACTVARAKYNLPAIVAIMDDE